MSRSIIEIRHLRTIKAIADFSSVSKAAQALYLTQSAISHQLKQLEQHYEMPVISRHDAKTVLTPLGKRLHDLAIHVLQMVQHCDVELDQMIHGQGGSLRIAVECHTCFDWLMPAMDAFRALWPDVELDIVSGFHVDAVGLLHTDDCDLAIVSHPKPEPGMINFPLFGFEMQGVVSIRSQYTQRPFLKPADFLNQPLISYPVPDDMLDVVQFFLKPNGVTPQRKTAQLTIAILQLVASGRGFAALPNWALRPYVEKKYVAAMRLGKKGLFSSLHAVLSERIAHKPFVSDFISMMRERCLGVLDGVFPLV